MNTNSETVINQAGRILTAKYLGRATSKKDLVVRLRTILHCLREDENVEPDDPSNYPGLAALCHALTKFVNHRDKEVRLYTVAACMELFTIYAPEAPWNEEETLDIFRQTIRQLANLGHSISSSSSGVGGNNSTTTAATTKSAHFHQYYRILELLAEVKIAVLLVDLSKKNDDKEDDNGNGNGNGNNNNNNSDDSSSSSSSDCSSSNNDNHNESGSKRRRSGRNNNIGSNKSIATTNTKNTHKNSTNSEALQVLSELFRTLLQSIRNEHPSDIFDYCQKTLTSCVEEFFESTILPVPILDELLVCIGQGPRVLVLQQQTQTQTQTKAPRQPQKNGKGRTRTRTTNNNNNDSDAANASKKGPLYVYVQQNNPSYMVASAVVRASVERLSTPIASLVNGLVNSDPRSIGESTISNHVVCEQERELDPEERTQTARNNNGNGNNNETAIPAEVLEMTHNLGVAQRQQQDAHGSSNVYNVILELQRIAPAILTTVIGNLASHVETPDVAQRLLVVQTLGKLFAGTGTTTSAINGGISSGGDKALATIGENNTNSNNGSLTVAYQYNPCFRKWLQRSGDRRIEIRRIMLPHLLALTKVGSAFLMTSNINNNNTNTSPQAELAREVQEALIQKLTQEPSAKFRTEVVQGLCTLSYNHRKILSRKVMDQLGERVMSKDRAERKDALTGLLQLHFRQYTRYHLATVIEGGDDCPIESVLDVLDECCPPPSNLNGAVIGTAASTSGAAATSLIAARAKASSSLLASSTGANYNNYSPRKNRKRGRKGGRLRRKRNNDGDSDSDERDDDGDGDRDEHYQRYGADDFSYYQWIPCVLFESASYSDATDTDMHSRVVQLVDELLLGCSSPHPDNRRKLTSTARATGMVMMVDAVRNQSPLAWYWMGKLQSVRAKLQKTLKAYLEARADIRNHQVGSEEHFAADAEAKDLLELVASMIPQPNGASPAPGERHAVLEKFHSIKDKHIFRILGTITNPSHSAKSRARALDDLPKRVKATAGDAVSAWVKSLAKRCAMGDFVNLDGVHHCVLLAQECFHEGELEATRKFLVCVQMAVESFPSLCASGEVFENLSELFRDCNKETEEPAIITALSAILASVAPYRDSSDDSSLLEEDLHIKLVALCQNGTPEQARHAVATIASLLKPKKNAALTQEETDTFLPLLQTLATPSRLAIASTGSSTKLVCVLAALTELADNAPEVFASSSRGMKALKFALEMVLMGRAHVETTSDDEDDSDSCDDDEAEEIKTPKRGRNQKKSSDRVSHLSPIATGTSLVEDENLSISCRTLCAAIEFLSTFIRSSVFVAKKARSTLPQTTQDIIGQVFKIFSQILRDQGMPPSSRDHKSCSLRQERAALRQCAAIHLFRLCDTRLGLDQKYLTTQRWHNLASSFLDDEPVVRKAVMGELGLMITGHGKFSATLGMGAMAPRLRFVAMSVFCIDGSQGSLSRANGNAANIGKDIHNQKGNIAGCIAFLRKVYESNAVQCRAQGTQAEKQFETFTKLTIMPEYAVPYAFHLLSCRHETPSSTKPGRGTSRKANDDEDYEVDENGQKVLRKRLKALYDPLVLQLGASADNISFLLRMAEMLAKSFEPIDCTLGTPGNANSAREKNKLKNICATAREVLLSYVKTDANLDTHPGAIRMPGNLFRRREFRKRRVKELSSTTDTSPILDMMVSTEDSVLEKQNNSVKVIRKRSISPTENNKHNHKQKQTRRSTRSSRKHDDSDAKMSVSTDGTPRNAFDTDENTETQNTSRIAPRRSTRSFKKHDGSYSKMSVSTDATLLNDVDTVKNTDIQNTSLIAPRRSTRSSRKHGDSDANMSASTGDTSKNVDDTDENTENQNNRRIAPRRSARSTRATKFDEPGDSKISDSIGSEYEDESVEKALGTIESSQLSNDAMSTIASSRDIMHSPEGRENLSSSKLDIGSSNKKRQSETSQDSFAHSRVHFSPAADFGGLSPINRRSSRNHTTDDILLSSSETKTRGTTPPSSLRDAKFSATASVALGSTRSPNGGASESPTPVSESTINHSVGGSSSHSNGKAKPLRNKKVEAAQSRRKYSNGKLAVEDKENATTKKKKEIPKQIKIVRSKPSPKRKVSKVVKKKTLARVVKRGKGKKSKPIDTFDFEG